jgi:glycosyltransferase involved in cell wall biosynthesis
MRLHAGREEIASASPRHAGSRPRIALLSTYPVDHVSFSGGVETSTAALLEGLRGYSQEFEFHIVSASNGIRDDIHERRGDFWFHFIGGLHRPWVRPRLPLRVFKARQLLRRIQPALVHCQANPDLALAAILAHQRPVLTIHGVAAHEAHWRAGREFWSTQTHGLVVRMVAPHVRAYICISQYVAGTLDLRHPKYAIPNAVSSTFLHDECSCTIGPPRVLFVGVIAPLKRARDLLAAHQELQREFPDIETILCGPVDDEGYARDLQREIAERHISGLSIIGGVDQASVARLLHQSRVLVLPSAQENAPMAIAEAMAIGVPVVATAVGGVPEMVRDGVTGLLYEPGDIDTLVKHTGRLLRDAQLRRAYGERAWHLARERYTPAAVAAATVGVYRELGGTLRPASSHAGLTDKGV